MAKGDRKRAKSGSFFQTCNKVSPKGKKAGYKPVAGPSSAPDRPQSKGNNSVYGGNSTKRLRTRPRPAEDGLGSGNRIVNIKKMVFVMNHMCKTHASMMEKCKNVNFEICKEVKQGLAWSFQFKCTNCSFVSMLYSTFSEIPNTKKSAAINTNLAIALMDTSMGVSKARLLFTSLDIPPPTKSLLQRLTDKVSQDIICLNKADMADKRRMVMQHNLEAGVGNPKHIDVSMDGRYNARGFKSSYKPGQSSSQAYTVAIENMTKERYIIGLAVENKLCWTGAWLRNRGFDVLCPGGHVDCTANIPYLQPHSERKMAYKIAEDLSLEDFWIRTVTTDGDSKIYLGLQDFYEKLSQAWHISHQQDPYHLGSRQEKKARTSQFSAEFLPEHLQTKEVRQRALAAVSKDIRARSSAIIDELTRVGHGDLVKMLPRLPSVRRATILCYSGNCSVCPEESLVCSGVSEGCWWVKSAYLPTHGISRLKMDENDISIMEIILEMRLSEMAVASVSSNTSTQKAEAFNRAVVSTLNKETNFSRNFGGRLAAQVHKSNNSISTSVKRKLHCISGTTLSETSSHHLDQISKSARYHKTYKSTGAYKKKRIANRARLEFEHHLLRSKDSKEEDYIKGQADEQWHTYASPQAKPSKRKKVKLDMPNPKQRRLKGECESGK